MKLRAVLGLAGTIAVLQERPVADTMARAHLGGTSCSERRRPLPLCATSNAALAGDQSRSETLTGIIGARRACTVSMISPLSMP